MGNEYLLKVLKKFNRMENITDEWIFVREEIEREQIRVFERWVNGRLGDKTAKERIRSMRWLLQTVNQIQKSGKSAKDHLDEINAPHNIVS
jgi:hypothetical protein